MSRVERDAYSFTSPLSQPAGTWKYPKASRIFIFLVDARQKISHRREKESQDESYESMTSRVDDGTAKGRRQERGGKRFRRTTKERQGFVLIIDDIRHSSIYLTRSRLTTKEHDERRQTRGSCRAGKHDAEMANAVFHAFNARLIA